MSKAIELAEAYSNSVSEHRLESMYGTSKSYTLEKAKERDEASEMLTAELLRLAAVEQELADIRALKPTAYYYKYITPYGDEVWSTEIPSSRTASEVVPLYAIKAAK